jgi:hypothetical protein
MNTSENVLKFTEETEKIFMIMFKEWGGGEKYGTRHFIIVNRLEQGDA